MTTSDSDLPLIGFFPLFYNLAETGRAVLVAKRYIAQGGTAVFFSHGGEYESLAKKLGCEVISVAPHYTDEFIADLWKYSRLEKFGAPLKKTLLGEHVEAESAAFKDAGVEWIVTTNNFPCSLSARFADIPLVSITPRFYGRFRSFPEDAEFYVTEVMPKWLKLAVLNWMFPRSKMWSRPFNQVARELGLSIFHNPQDIAHGDYTFYTDFLELVDIPATSIKDSEYFVGPIFFDELFHASTNQNNMIPQDIQEHIKKGDRSIVVSLGSSGIPRVFNGIIDALNGTDYRVIAIYTSVLSADSLPECSENVLLQQYVPSLRALNEQVDLAVLHGGQGTVYSAAYAGKPVIGFPMQLEQHMNLEMLVGKGMARIASRRHFTKKSFLALIEDMFMGYDTYLENAQALSATMPPPEGEDNCVRILLDLMHH
ncbi:MAG: hypothetical protein KKC68_09030 [Candidatus Thermoplasmatota archaeon]|nr:hypothetical protein [Candidatus Thermoplasmatota archaeon]